MGAQQREQLLNGAIMIVALCALTTTSMAAYRTLKPPPPKPTPAATIVRDWRALARGGHRFGAADAPVTIVEFSDFQCPFCKGATSTLRHVRDTYGDRVAIVYRHFPLERIHRFARPAAIASECAARQGRFEAFHDVMFSTDTLGKKPWAAYATAAGVSDARTFVACLDDPAAADVVDADVVDGSKLGVNATPTIVVNQYRVTGGANPAVLDSLVRLALASPSAK